MPGHSNGSTRDLREGVVTFATWTHENEHQKVEAAYFAEGIENSLKEFPPLMVVEAKGLEEGRYDDLEIEFDLAMALGDECYNGPSWKFSLKDALTDFDCSKEDALALLVALQAVVEHLKREINRMPERWTPHPSRKREARVIGLDGKDDPSLENRRKVMELLAPLVCKDLMETISGKPSVSKDEQNR